MMTFDGRRAADVVVRIERRIREDVIEVAEHGGCRRARGASSNVLSSKPVLS
jgi:hypothetical protein